MSRKPRPNPWENVKPLTDEEITYWIEQLPICDYMSGTGRQRFFAALKELQVARAEKRVAELRAQRAAARPLGRARTRLKAAADRADVWRGVTWDNLTAGVRDQQLWDFLITGNAWGIFNRRSHFNRTGKEKISHLTKQQAWKHAASMQRQHGGEFEAYKCVFCDAYHIGQNRP